MTITEDIAALREALARKPSKLASMFGADPVSQAMEFERRQFNWLYSDFAEHASPDRIKRVLDALDLAQDDAAGCARAQLAAEAKLTKALELLRMVSQVYGHGPSGLMYAEDIEPIDAFLAEISPPEKGEQP